MSQLPERLRRRPFVRARDVALPVVLAAFLAWNVCFRPWWWTAPNAVVYIGLVWADGYVLAKRVASQERLEELDGELRRSAGRAGLN